MSQVQKTQRVVTNSRTMKVDVTPKDSSLFQTTVISSSDVSAMETEVIPRLPSPADQEQFGTVTRKPVTTPVTRQGQSVEEALLPHLLFSLTRPFQNKEQRSRSSRTVHRVR
uniref:Uncharacterized protein n=1 Tax=Cacopsylla melanoneura TaxID=428564 RepID=A0A8D9AQS3_9HEMI